MRPHPAVVIVPANRQVRRLARALGLLALAALVLASIVVGGADPIAALVSGSFAAVGLVLIARRPRERIGWLLVLVAVGFVPRGRQPAGQRVRGGGRSGVGTDHRPGLVQQLGRKLLLRSVRHARRDLSFRAVPGPSPWTLAVAVSTLAAFAVFQPLRHRIQAMVDRRFNRARYDADHVVAGLAACLRGEVALDAVINEVADAARASVAPASATVWLGSHAG